MIDELNPNIIRHVNRDFPIKFDPDSGNAFSYLSDDEINELLVSCESEEFKLKIKKAIEDRKNGELTRFQKTKKSIMYECYTT